MSIHGKTASLFGTAARIGGIVAGLERELIDDLTEWGNAFGMVFQIVDDILDITDTTEQLGKPAGHDLVEGVYTLPVLRTLALDRTAGEELGSLLGGPLDVAERDKALAIVRANEGVESAIVSARQYVDAAEAACADLPSSPATEALPRRAGSLPPASRRHRLRMVRRWGPGGRGRRRPCRRPRPGRSRRGAAGWP